MPELVFFRRSDELMRVRLEGRRTTVGRAPGSDVLVPDPSVSRQHFAIEQRGDAWFLTDLTGHGCELAGKAVFEAALSDGSDIGLGQWRAVFQLQAAGSLPDETTQRRAAGDTVVQERTQPEARLASAHVHVRSDAQSRSLQFVGGEIVVGSGEECGLRLQDPFVSATHVHIARRDGAFLVRDLGSRNGTFVGAVRLVEAEVPFGCPIRVGGTELTLLRGDRDAEIEVFEGMVGSDPSMRKVFEVIERVAPSQAAVSIFGESGTGKELVARAIHAKSSRASRPFVPVNCGALSKELVESELFGHEKGAFTGADRMRKGAFEEADGGTLFLDEIGELPLGLQAKLLRALELGEIKRVGATRPMNVDVRVVAATNRDLRTEVKRGAFREDLYWRLSVVPLQLPPLRARKGDVKRLVTHFLAVYAPQGAAVGLTPDAERKLLLHSWPGNVRELKNALHRAMLLRRGPSIDASDLTFDRDLEMTTRAAETEGAYDPDLEDLERVFIVNKPLEAVEDEMFLKTFKRLGPSPSVIAKALGVSRGAVYRKFDKLGIHPAEPRSGDEE